MEEREPDPYDDVALEPQAFESLEQDFHSVMDSMRNDPAVEVFRNEYETLHKALVRSHQTERRLQHRCKELNQEILTYAAKVQAALDRSRQDSETINQIRKDIEKSIKMVNDSREQERRARETIETLRAEIDNLTKLVQAGGAGLSTAQEAKISDLTHERDRLAHQRDHVLNEIAGMRAEATELVERARVLEDDKAQLEKEIHEIVSAIKEKKLESEKEQARRKRADNEYEVLKEQLALKVSEINQKREMQRHLEGESMRLEHAVRAHLTQRDAHQKQARDLQLKYGKLRDERDQVRTTNSQLCLRNNKLQQQQRQKTEEIDRATEEEAALRHQCDDWEARRIDQRARREQFIRQRDQLKEHLKALDDTKAGCAEAADQKAKAIKETRRAINNSLQMLINETRKADDVAGKVVNVQSERRTLIMQIENYKRAAAKKRKMITQLKTDQESYVAVHNRAAAMYGEALEELRQKEARAIELQKEILADRTRLKSQQNLYESMVTERNNNKRKLRGAGEQIAELQRKALLINYQIDQLKEEIKAKDKALMDQNFALLKVKAQSKALKQQQSNLGERKQASEETITSLNADTKKLGQIITTSELQVKRQREEYKAVMNERDILGRQLIHRNEEIAALYEKIKIQQSTLNKGEIQYREKMQEVYTLRTKIAALKQEIDQFRSKMGSAQVLRAEVVRLEQGVLAEQCKARALQDELQTPMNVHRWHRLEGSDPEAFSLLKRIQTIQRRLITKTEEVTAKDQLIEEKERLYRDLKQLLDRKPGTEVDEQLAIYEQIAKEKKEHLKKYRASLDTARAQVSEYQYEVRNLGSELEVIKRRYVDQAVRAHFRHGPEAQEGEVT